MAGEPRVNVRIMTESELRDYLQRQHRRALVCALLSGLAGLGLGVLWRLL